MADYVVRLTGQDNLSNTVKQVKKELSDVGNVGSTAIDKIDRKFNRIIESSAPLKRQLRDLQNILSEMNFKGLQNTDEFTKVAEAAGQIKDAITDAQEATRYFSSDTMKLDAVVQSFQGIAAGASIATGAMALFGSENQEAAEAIKKVQGALAILNGVQTVANMLQKDSAISLRLSQIMMAAKTKGTVTDTIAQKAWNTTKAIGKALLGDWTGLLLVGAAGLTAYSIATSKTTAKQDELNASTKKGSEIQSQYTSTLGQTYSNLMTKYTQLRSEWSKLSNEHQKAQWIKQNKQQLNELQISVNNVADAERAFNGNTDAVVQAFVKRAKAAARLAQLTELYRKQIELIDKRNQTATQIQADAARSGRHANAGDEITDQTFRSSRYGSVNSAGKWVFSEQGAKLYSGNDTSSNSVIKQIDSQIDGVNREIGKVVDAIQDEASTPFLKSESGGRTSKAGTTNSNDKKEIIKGSLADLENQLTELQNKLKDGLIPNDKLQETIVRVEELKNEILKKKIELGLEIDPKLKEDEETKKRVIDEVNKWFESNTTTVAPPNISTFEKATNVNPYDESTLSGIQNLMDYNDSLIEKLEETRQKLLELREELKNAGLEGSDAFNQVNNRLSDVDGQLYRVKESQETLSDSASNITNDKNKIEEQSEAWSNYSEMLGGVSNAMGVLGETQEAQMAQFAVNTASILANAVSTIAAMNAEALAKGASSAFSLPFPANLAAWATVFTTITSIFASLPKFAEGGIIGGGSNHGDTILSRLNAGEMVLNTRQQSNLFKAINNGDFEFNSQTTETPSLEFKIKGSDLYGTLKNYSKTVGKSGKITGIK